MDTSVYPKLPVPIIEHERVDGAPPTVSLSSISESTSTRPAPLSPDAFERKLAEVALFKDAAISDVLTSRIQEAASCAEEVACAIDGLVASHREGAQHQFW